MPFIWAALGVVYVVWGSTYLGIRIVIETMPPLLGGAIRFIAAGIVLGAVLAIRYGPSVLRLRRHALGSAVLVGILLLTFGNGGVSIAEQHISSGLTALLIASVPLWLVVFRRLAGDRPHWTTITGVAIGFGGLSLLSLTRGGSTTGSVFGIVFVLGAACAWATGSFMSGRLRMPANPFVAAVYEMLAGGLALIVLGLARGETLRIDAYSTRSWVALAYLIVFGSLLAFTSYVWLLGNAPISLVGTYAYVNPTVAVLLGAAILGERVTWATMIGGAIILVGVGLVVSTERRGRVPARQSDGAEPTDPVALGAGGTADGRADGGAADGRADDRRHHAAPDSVNYGSGRRRLRRAWRRSPRPSRWRCGRPRRGTAVRSRPRRHTRRKSPSWPPPAAARRSSPRSAAASTPGRAARP
jgi:drug/metabolite transporter (DMT)-like permease